MKKKKKKRNSKNYNKQNLNRKRMHKKAKHSTSKNIKQKVENNNLKENLENNKQHMPDTEIKKKIETLENTVDIKEKNNEIEQVKSEITPKTTVLLEERPTKRKESKENETQALEKNKSERKEKKEKRIKKKKEKIKKLEKQDKKEESKTREPKTEDSEEKNDEWRKVETNKKHKIDKKQKKEAKLQAKKEKKAKKAEKRKKHRILKFIIKFFLIIIILLLLALIAGMWGFAGLLLGWYGNEDIQISKEDLVIKVSNSVIVDQNGTVLADLSGDEKRKIITLEDMAEYLPKAYIAIEDERFYEHSGVDFKRTAGAIANTLLNGNSSYGGSTITQQLVKNITNDNESTGIEGIKRKIREWQRAYQVERMISKEQILELYLNILFVGANNLHGVELGAEYYFNKSAKDLSLAECAFMAGINHSPNSYNPYNTIVDNSEKIKNRTITVLDKMKELGYLSEEE